MKHLHAYIHGFASSSQSRKGQELKRRFAQRDLRFECPELNRPSFATQTFTLNLAYLDRLDQQMQDLHGPFTWRLIGSSMGGYLSARWAELRPDRVDRLLLLCPAFDFVARWPALLGTAVMTRWEADRSFLFPGPTGKAERLHWEFMTDVHRHPAQPRPRCPMQIIHGTRDFVVPIQISRDYIASHPEIRLHEVDDDHPLEGSIDKVWSVAQDFLI